MKFTKPFKGVPDGEVYPVDYEPGQDCPPELEAGAQAMGALGDDKSKTDPGGHAQKTVPEIKAALDAAGIAYKPTASKPELLALLPA